MTRPKIKSALISIFAIITITVGGFAVYALNQLSQINGNVGEVSTNWLPSVSVVRQLATTVSDLKVAYRDQILSVDKNAQAKATQNINAVNSHFDQQVDDYRKLARLIHDQHSSGLTGVA